MLAEACEASLKREPSLKLEVVRSLARDISSHLNGLADEDIPPGLLAEAAQRCADLATLAACNAGELDHPHKAAETVRLAAEATETLSRIVEANASPDGEGSGGENDLVRRDGRSASWKASLAVRQFEEMGGREPG